MPRGHSARLAVFAAVLLSGPVADSEDANACDDCVKEAACHAKYEVERQRCTTEDKQSSMMKAVACETDAANAYDRCESDARRQCERAKKC